MFDTLQTKADAIYDLARAEWEREKTDGFRTLKSIPSSNIKRFLKFYESLSPKDATRWSNFTLLHVPCMFLNQWRPAPSHDDEKWFREHSNASFAVFWGWETWGLRELKNAIGWSKSEKAGSLDVSWIPPDKIEWLQYTSTAKATHLRRIIKPLFREEFDLSPQNMGGGDWIYKPVDGTDFLRINLDFGGRISQLRYDMEVTDANTNISGKRLSFESILGVTCTGWDWITEKEAEQSCQLLVNLIKRVLDFTSRVSDGIKENKIT